MSTLDNSFIESIQRTLHENVRVRTILGQTYIGEIIKFDPVKNILVLECNNSSTKKVVSLFLDHVVVIE